MAWPCNSESQRVSSISNSNEGTYICKFKLEYPPIINSTDLPQGVLLLSKENRVKLSNLNYSQNTWTKKKLKFQCHYEERKRRAEQRRKKILQKLKKIYQIDVDCLNENVKREVIMKAEEIEKKKKEREKRKVEKSMIMMTRLLEDLKYKHRKSKICRPPRRKTVNKIIYAEKEEREPESKIYRTKVWEEGDDSNGKAAMQTEIAVKSAADLQARDSKQFPPEGEEYTEEEKTGSRRKCVETRKADYIPQIYVVEKKTKPKPQIEKCLEATPRKVLFQDYEKNKIYLQPLKITNISCDTIHCRYLGIAVHTKTEDKFPIGVAVRDSVKLRPGLSCSTKIRLCSQDDTERLECSIVYETRRPRANSHLSWFTVPVACIPVQAIVKVTPLKITFPTLSWYEATGADGAKRLCKTLKLENSGGKACSCKISGTKLPGGTDEGNNEVEGEGEVEFPKYGSYKEEYFDNKNYGNLSANGSEELCGEGSYVRETQEIVNAILNEICNNVFSTFRFSPKYDIQIPPYSTVYIQVRFIPNYKGFHHETHFIQFANCDNSREEAIELIGDIKKMPLRTEPQVIDLKTCIANSGVYSGTFKVFNDSKGPYWVTLKVPSSIKNHAHIYPKTTVILPFSFSIFSVKIYPRVTLARDAPRYYNEDSQILEFPVFVHPANIGSCWRDYIKIYVLALITDYCLELSPSSINFGTVSTVETVRTELELTNHSLAAQEYGFLNLPKGVRVEPNMGFGTILPKESIRLYLLYSPEEDFFECQQNQKYDEFQVIVTSIAKYGGFREKLEAYEDSLKPIETWGEDNEFGFSSTEINPITECRISEEFDDFEENSSVEGEELSLKIYQQENKIRDFLQQDPSKTADIFFCERLSTQCNLLEKTSEVHNLIENVQGECGDSITFRGICNFNKDLHIVSCHATVIKPRCRLSDSIIQLPATPCSSFSLYRFRLICTGENSDGDCICGFRKNSKKSEDESNSRIRFEFQYECPLITLEPGSGFLKPGDSIPITVIFRPLFPPGIESQFKKEEKTISEKKAEQELASQYNSGMKSKSKQLKTSSNSLETIMKALSQKLKSAEYFTGEKVFEKLFGPFLVKTEVQCIVNSTKASTSNRTTEIHRMVVICPVINPKFIYLGKCQEINFDKVLIGMKSKKILEIQNVSFERISPSATLLNPVGHFYCPAGLQKVELDPEHIWRLPLIYAPLSEKGIEKQFFEIYCGSTNILLSVTGEGIQPNCKITPNFACCVIDAKPGSKEELRLDLENLSVVALRLVIQTNFFKSIPNFDYSENDFEDLKSKKDKTPQKEEFKEKKKSKKLYNSNFKFWDEIPETISSSLENSYDFHVDVGLKIISLTGLNENSEIVISPLGKNQIKILFSPPPDKTEGLYATEYGVILEKDFLLKEMLVIGRISSGK